MTIAVTGATGQLGRIAIEHLKTQTDATNIVALARSPEKLADAGVQTRAFDYNQPENLAAALNGVETLGLISSSEFEDRTGQHRAVIEAAKAAGVKRIAYTSILKADQSPMMIAQDHKATEEILRASGLNYTFLRNNWYVENWTAGIPAALEAGAMIGSVGEGRVSAATRQDLGEALAVVLANDGHDNQVYELGSDTPFTLSELSAEISAQSGKELPYNNLPAETYAEILGTFGLPEPFGAVVADAETHASQGWMLDESKTLSRLIGHPTASLADVVRSAMP